MIAPDLAVLKEGLQHLEEGQQQIRADAKQFQQQIRADAKQFQQQIRGHFKDLESSALATETRLQRSIEAAKAEVLLTMRVARQEERIAELTAILERARGSHGAAPQAEHSAPQGQ